MTKLSLLFIALFCTSQLSAQQIDDSLSSQIKDTSKYENAPVLILRRPFRGYVQTTNVVLNMLNVDSINVFYAEKPGIYAQKAKNGLIEFNLQNIVPLVNFDELMAIYKISANDQELPFFIDSVFAYKPKQTYFELGAVLSVKISTEKSSGMKFVNITTLFPRPKHINLF